LEFFSAEESENLITQAAGPKGLNPYWEE